MMPSAYRERLGFMPRISSCLSGTSAGQHAIAHTPAMRSANAPMPTIISLPVTMANQKSIKKRTRQTMIVMPAQAGRWPKVDGAGARMYFYRGAGRPRSQDPTWPPLRVWTRPRLPSLCRAV